MVSSINFARAADMQTLSTRPAEAPAHSNGRRRTLPILNSGSCEPLKAGVHGFAMGLAAVMGLYNAAAWVQRRQRHLAVNAIIYALAIAWEQRHVAHHITACRQLANCREALAAAHAAQAETAKRVSRSRVTPAFAPHHLGELRRGTLLGPGCGGFGRKRLECSRRVAKQPRLSIDGLLRGFQPFHLKVRVHLLEVEHHPIR